MGGWVGGWMTHLGFVRHAACVRVVAGTRRDGQGGRPTQELVPGRVAVHCVGEVAAQASFSLCAWGGGDE